jgi:serine/threonine protein kinase/Tol biopolymer transport system component
VYKAWDPELERWVALRLIPPGLAGRPEERQPLIREARAVATLEHPNVGLVSDVGEAEDGSLFLVSTLCEGETLAQRLRRGPMRMEGAVELAAQIAAAVGRAHEHGLLHGRLRPSNVWIGSDGQVRVVDFGLSGLEERTWRTLRHGAPPPRELLAPELLLGESTSPRSDVWAIGALLAILLGRREGLSDDLARIVERALSSRPADRYPNAGTLRDDLRALRDPSPRPAGRAPGRMPELTGVRHLSQYRIGELLGGGGMGVVYRAEDVHLGRTVALKFLAADLVGDPAAKARFLQEARAASALDHPNICTVYEIGETGENHLYLAMPCYEGETLKARIARGPLPVNEALDYALQAAKGLARAHRQGIVHRDIKPANLMITSDGLVKILDFGVAKLSGESTLTRAGVAVGTAAYMAPEQVRGEEVDARADLWSLGVVLYEMVTGRRPFPGDNPEAIRHAVLTREPEPVARLRPDASAGLDRIVRGLLAKGAADRYPTADAVAADLRLLLGVSSGSLSALPLQAPRSRAARLRWVGLALLAVLAGLAGGLWLRSSRQGPVPATFTRITQEEGAELYPSLSPDGAFFVYVQRSGGDLDIFLRRIGGSNPVLLTGDSEVDDTEPAYSPDGRSIAFRSERGSGDTAGDTGGTGGIFIMESTGGPARQLTDFGYNPAWSPDGKAIAVGEEDVVDPSRRRTKSQIWRVDVASGRRTRITRTDSVQPSWSPHGSRIAYWGLSPQTSRRVIYTVPAGGGPPVPAAEGGSMTWNPVWSPDGRYLYFASDRSGSMNLWRMRIDEESGRVSGEPEAVVTPSPATWFLSLSADGRRIAYTAMASRRYVERVAFDPKRLEVMGSPVEILRGTRNFRSLDVSPDGRWIAFFVSDPADDLFVARSDGSGLRPLTNDLAKDRHPCWSPDGSMIAFSSNRGGLNDLWAIRPDGSGLQPLTRGRDLVLPLWSPDGRRLAATSDDGTVLVDLQQPLAERVPRPLPPIRGIGQSLYPSAWSPDGDRIAGNDPRSGIGIYTLSTGAYERFLDQGSDPKWLPDGRTLLLFRDKEIWSFDTRTRLARKVLAPPEYSGFQDFVVGPGGRDLILIRTVEDADVWMATLD